ncbi:hypothetical protein VNO80_15004 [Phaseolus coccineus]|uniref:ATPase family AAA domain-containing protein n=1 Tax=Phaseolus coccineus TaxID=3886 RepID=A0AAN9R6K6_PHACN
MAAARLTSFVAVTSAAVVSMSTFSDRAYAHSSFRIPFFSSSPSNAPSLPNQSSDSISEPPAPEEPNKSGFDPESLERGAKALREINSSSYSKQRLHNVELVKMQEESSVRKERARQATEEQIQSQQRQTERERES